MGAVDLPYLDSIRSKGRTYYYYRRGRLRRRIEGEPGSEAFHAAYARMHALAEAVPASPAAPVEPRSLAALIDAYRASSRWTQGIAQATRNDYDKALVPLREKYGRMHVSAITRPLVLAIQERYATAVRPDQTVRPTPRRANRMVAVLSILLSHAVDLGWRTDNPALRPRKLRTGPGWRAWTDLEIRTVLEAVSTPAPVRLAIQLALATGQRGEDLIAMTWSAYDGTAVEVVQGKTGARVWVPVNRRVRAVLAIERDRIGAAAGTILTRQDGRAWKIDHFRHAMGAAIRDAGVVGVVAHGLRATAATWLAEAGCSEREIMAITGHTSSQSVSGYVRDASRRIGAASAVRKLEKHRPGTAGAKPQGSGGAKPLRAVRAGPDKSPS